MTAYVPQNLNIYTAAFAGAMATTVNPYGAAITDPNQTDYSPFADVATAWAEAVDTSWGTDAANSYSIECIQSLSQNWFLAHPIAPTNNNVFVSTSNWLVTTAAVVAAVKEGSIKLTAEGIVPPPPPGGLSPTADQRVYVSKGGSDITGNGTFGRPFLTIQKGMALVAAAGDASSGKRYVIQCGAGTYTDAITWEPWVWVTGDSRTCRLQPSTLALSGNWTTGDKRAGANGIHFLNAANIDFSSVSSAGGIFYLNNCIFGASPTFTGFVDGNTVTVENCRGLAFSQVGCFTNVYNSSFQNNATFTMTSTPSVKCRSVWLGSATDGPVTINYTGGHAQTFLNLIGSSALGLFTLNGPGTFITSTTPALFPGGVTLTGGATDPRQDITGSKGGNAALASTITGLVALGGFKDSST